jgi:hypothetical protein
VFSIYFSGGLIPTYLVITDLGLKQQPRWCSSFPSQ